MKNNKIFITQPLMPKLDDISASIAEIMESKWLTNMGKQHKMLEEKLREVLKVPHISVFNNGTIALLTALKALDLPFGSEVITTPLTFAATPHCITWNGLKPVFCDIEPETLCIDADKIEALINDNTSAILGVHVYGFPCNVEKIEKIAQKHNLKVIYDAAHAFSTEINGKGIGEFGDITMFSFHATKLFNTIEGGCLSYNNPHLKQKIYNLRNFGIIDEETVQEVGINGKMNEIQAAIGLLNLELFENEKKKRAIVKENYHTYLSNIEGIKILQMPSHASDSYQYYPILISQDSYGISRDDLYLKLKENDIYSRKYFYPICSDYDCYKNLASSTKDNLKIANKVKNEILCLPFYGDLTNDNLIRICHIIQKK